MSKNGSAAAQPYAMLYGRRGGGPRMYLGADLIPDDLTNEEARELLTSRTLAEWFEEVEIVVNRPQA